MPDWDPPAITLRQLLAEQDWRPVEYGGSASEAEIDANTAAPGVWFPKSSGAFSRNFGTRPSNAHDVSGLPGDRLWGDILAKNQIATRSWVLHLVKFIDNMGERDSFLDTSGIGSEGECLVVVLQSGGDRYVVADSYLGFLHKSP